VGSSRSGQREVVPRAGRRDLVLTLDRTVQETPQSILDEGVKQYQAKGGVIIVVDRRRATSLRWPPPDYDLTPSRSTIRRTLSSTAPPVSDVYEPGR